MNSSQKIATAFDKYAGEYLAKFGRLTIYDQTYDACLQLLQNKNADVLETGCGPGNVTKYFLERLPQLNITAVDISAAMIDVAKSILPGVNFMVMDARNVAVINNKFDLIISAFCIPYLDKNETAQLLIDFGKMLKPGGILYLSWIEGDDNCVLETSSNGENQMFINYYSSSFIERLARDAGMKPSETFSIKYHRNETHVDNHLVRLLKKF